MISKRHHLCFTSLKKFIIRKEETSFNQKNIEMLRVFSFSFFLLFFYSCGNKIFPLRQLSHQPQTTGFPFLCHCISWGNFPLFLLSQRTLKIMKIQQFSNEVLTFRQHLRALLDLKPFFLGEKNVQKLDINIFFLTQMFFLKSLVQTNTIL